MTRLASEQPSLVKSLLLKKPVLVSGEQTIGYLRSIISPYSEMPLITMIPTLLAPLPRHD
jgi:hypothetical protein